MSGRQQHAHSQRMTLFCAQYWKKTLSVSKCSGCLSCLGPPKFKKGNVAQKKGAGNGRQVSLVDDAEKDYIHQKLVGELPFWPDCLHIKFQKIYLCKVIFYIFEIAFRKIKICNVIFYARQINYPEFKYVISWWSKSRMLAEALLPTRVSCTFPHSWPYL